MFLSTNFTVDEFTHSQEAIRSGINNDPTNEVLEKLKKTAYGMEVVRKILGDKPILISSGYRCLGLNRKIGSKDSSQHVQGEAVDFTCPTFGTPDQIVKALLASGLGFDQIIREYDRWVHISFSERNRQQALIIDKSGARAYA